MSKRVRQSKGRGCNTNLVGSGGDRKGSKHGDRVIHSDFLRQPRSEVRRIFRSDSTTF